MMLPSNTTLVNSLYKGFPKWLQRFFDHRSCQIYKHSNTQIETLAKKNKPSVFMKITGLENFEPHHYSMFANALTFVKQETEADDSTCRLFIKCPQGLVLPLQDISQRFCSSHKLRDSVILVEKCDNPWQKNTIDYICNDTERLSVGLLSEQRSNQHEAHESRPKDFAVKLSDVFDQYAEANEWIEAHRRHDCSVMFRVQHFSSKFPNISIPVFEHATAYGEIPSALVVATPQFSKSKSVSRQPAELNLLADSVYSIYQFCVRLSDNILREAMSALSTYSNKEIDEILSEHERNPSSYYAHKKLAEDIICITKGMEHGNLEALIPSIRYLHRGRPETADNFDSEDVEKLIPTVKLQYREGLSLPDVCQLILDNLPEIERPSFEKSVIYNTMMRGNIAVKESGRNSMKAVERSIDYDHVFTKNNIHKGCTMLTGKGRMTNHKYFVLIKWEGL